MVICQCSIWFLLVTHGTGKTLVARIMGEIFSDLDLLSKEKKFVEATRDTLIAEYVGQTAIKTKKIVNSALGGVLFIDEAYSLANTFDEKRQDFGPECISTLIKEMEDNRENLCVIFAGYKTEMQYLINSNTGFKDRIQFYIDFPDYTETELYKIFEQMAENEKFILDRGCKKVILDYFQNEIQNKDDTFSNGRLARNLFEKIKFEQASRIKKVNSTNFDLIIKTDIVNVVERVKTKSAEKVIGFRVS